MIRRRGTDGLRRRLAALSVIASTGFLLVVGQLWYLQILEGPGLAERSERNRIRVRPLPAPRGTLYDRNLVPLAETEPSFTLSVIPRELEKRQAVLAQLAILLKVPIERVCYPPTMGYRPGGTAIVLALLLLVACAAGFAHGPSAGPDSCGLKAASHLYGTVALGEVPAALDAWPATRPCLATAWVGVVDGAPARPNSASAALPASRAPPVFRLPSA